MDLARDEETRVRNLGRLALEKAAKAGASKAGSNGISRTFATVSRVNGDGTIDVSMGDYTDVNGVTSECILRGLRMTVACSGAQVGDRVIVDTYAHVSVVTGILANADNTHYVNGNCDIFIGSETVHINNQSWYDWLTKSQQVTKFGRSFNQNTDFFTVMNANVGLANYGLVSSYANGAGQLGFSISKAFTGSLKFNWLVVMAR